MVNNNETPGVFKHAWPAGSCLIARDSILTGGFEKQLSSSQGSRFWRCTN